MIARDRPCACWRLLRSRRAPAPERAMDAAFGMPLIAPRHSTTHGLRHINTVHTDGCAPPPLFAVMRHVVRGCPSKTKKIATAIQNNRLLTLPFPEGDAPHETLSANRLENEAPLSRYCRFVIEILPITPSSILRISSASEPYTGRAIAACSIPIPIGIRRIPIGRPDT